MMLHAAVVKQAENLLLQNTEHPTRDGERFRGTTAEEAELLACQLRESSRLWRMTRTDHVPEAHATDCVSLSARIVAAIDFESIDNRKKNRK